LKVLHPEEFMKRFAAVVGIALSLSYAAGAAMVTAYDSSSQVGNQQYSGSLGLDFNVNSPITITALGAYVDSHNVPTGLTPGVTVSIYDRTTGLAVASETVSGSANSPLGGYDLVNLPSALNLPAGFQGSVVLSGYGLTQYDCNILIDSSCTAPTLNSNGGLISFVGNGRFGAAGTYPTTVDLDGVNPYDAGTFSFDAQPSTGTPEPASLGLLSLGLIGLGAIRLRKRA
jgi:PEP-CTERM motif